MRDVKNVKERWHLLLDRVKMQTAHMGRRPMVPVSQIELLKVHFTDARSGKLVELDQDTFCAKMSEALKHRNYSEEELRSWFADVDVDLSNSVSWEEFTSFMISAASSFGEENIRSKEFLPDNLVTPMTSQLHKDSIKRIVTSRYCPYIVTGGFDGLVKLWSPSNGGHVYSINNNLYSAAHEAIPAGSTVPISPIIDICVNARGTHCFVAAADKSVNIYDSKTFALHRKFVGVAGSTLESSYWTPNSLGCDGVPDFTHRARPAAAGFRTLESAEASVLLELTESPSSFDIATPHDNEVMFFSTHEGSILAYPSLRSSVLPDVPRSAFYQRVHDMPISKLRYVPTLRALVTASWDTSFRLTDVNTGSCIHRLNGHAQQKLDLGGGLLDTVDVGHRKSALDFAYSDTFSMIATAAADRAVLLWNPMFSLPVASLRGHTAPLNSVAFDDIDHLLLSMDASGVCKTWDLRMNRCLQSFGGTGSNGADPSPRHLVDDKLDTPTAMIYSPEHHRVFAGGRSLKAWTVRRAQTHFNPTHIGHCEGVISFTPFVDSSCVVTGDANVLMRWNIRNGKRQALWDVNPPTADGGDMLRATGGGGSGGGGANATGRALTCFERDSAQRRVLAATADGALISFNPTNGQQLRTMEIGSYISDEPFRITHLCNALNTSKAIAVVTPREAVLVSEDADLITGLLPFQPFATISAAPPSDVLFSAVSSYPAIGQSTLAALVLGRTDGTLRVYHTATQELVCHVTHPKRVRTRHSSHRHQRRRSATTPSVATPSTPGGAQQPNSLLATTAPVEDIVYLRSLDLFVTCVGDNCLYFWDLRNGVLKHQHCTNLQPEECILSLASGGEDNDPTVSYDTALTTRKPQSLKGMVKQWQAEEEALVGDGSCSTMKHKKISDFSSLLRQALLQKAKEEAEEKGTSEMPRNAAAPTPPPPQLQHERRVLISACDWGFVYVWDLSELPHAKADASHFAKCVIPSLAVFRAHNAPITRMSFFQRERLICTMSTVDGYVKLFETGGTYVGHCGQRMPYWHRNARTFAADADSVVLDDPSQPQPAPPFSGTSGKGLPPRCGSRGVVGGRAVSPITPALVAYAGSRPATRQLDSPSSGLFSSSFFMTSPQSKIIRQPVGAAFGALDVVAVSDTAITADRQKVEGILRSSGPPSGAAGGASFAVVAPIAPTATTDTEFGFSPTFAASVLLDQSVGVERPGNVHMPHRAPFGSAFTLLGARGKLSLNDVHRIAAPGRGTEATTGVLVHPSAATGQANLRPLMFAKKRLSVHTLSTLEEGRRPRHLTSMYQKKGTAAFATSFGSDDTGGDEQPTLVDVEVGSNTPSSVGRMTPPVMLTPSGAMSAIKPPAAIRPRKQTPPLSALPHDADGMAVQALRSGQMESSHAGAAKPIVAVRENATPGGGRRPPKPSRPHLSLPGDHGVSLSQGDDRTSHDQSRLSSFLLTEVDVSDSSMGEYHRHSGDANFGAAAAEHTHRSHSVPVSLMMRSSTRQKASLRYRSRSSADSEVFEEPTAASEFRVSGRHGWGSSLVSHPDGGAATPLSPLHGSKFERSAVAASLQLPSIANLHKFSEHQQQHADTTTTRTVDRVGRLIRERELLRHRPLLVKSSLLVNNAEMQAAVEVLPSAWTSRVSSLLTTHPLHLDEIKTLWGGGAARTGAVAAVGVTVSNPFKK